MDVYLASPRTQQQAEHAAGMPVLLSFSCFSPWLHKGYQQSFSKLLIDSGAFGELGSGIPVDIGAYREFSEPWRGHAEAIAGLDDIRGDWRRSLRNYAEIPWGFPTWHDSDPLELIPELVDIARECGNWIAIGLVPPRSGKESIVRKFFERIPPELHVHGWALREYTHVRRLDSVDSTNWWRDAQSIRKQFPFLTYGECLEIVVKRYQRWTRNIVDSNESQGGLFQ